jgi:hypothetical protein
MELMKFTSALLASACVLALAAPASAQWAGTAALGYGHAEVDGAGVNEGILNGAADYTVSDGFNLEGDVGYEHLSTQNNGVDGANWDWNIGSTAFWADPSFRVGGTVNYSSLKFGTDSGSANFTNYGAFGEYFLDCVTLGVKGGGFSGSNSIGGSYVGGEAVGYAMPDLALSGTIDYTKFNGHSGSDVSETDFGPQGEWLFSHEIPLTLYAGYAYSSLKSGPLSDHVNTFYIGIRFYTNGAPDETLEQHHRTGTVGWGASFQPFLPNLL